MWLRALELLLRGLPLTTTAIHRFCHQAALGFFLSSSPLLGVLRARFLVAFLASAFSLFLSPRFSSLVMSCPMGGKCVKFPQCSLVSFLFRTRLCGTLFLEG